ncbi:MAG: FG-GAP-like repeat-containing protein [Planctomycetota bacterium]
MSAAIAIGFATVPMVNAHPTAESGPQFMNMSSVRGLVSYPQPKYGGPCVADFNGDGFYDFMLGNHDQTPIQYFASTLDGDYVKQPNVFYREDVHGLAAGDYDRDGDVDLLVSLGGGNGTNPKPPRLLRNDGGTFTNVTNEVGIAGMGSRGRSVRWLDADNDGDLDLLQINAKPAANETGPRHILFENLGDGTFEYAESPAIEQLEADKILVTDFNSDGVSDLVVFTPWSQTLFLAGDGAMGFVDKSTDVLPDSLDGARYVTAIAEADIDRDGDMDYYLARGGATSGGVLHLCDNRLMISDNGQPGPRSIKITSTPGSGLDLRDPYYMLRPGQKEPPIFLGADKTPIPSPRSVKWVDRKAAAGLPDNVDEDGWYLSYLGGNDWQLTWNSKEQVAWSVQLSIDNVASYEVGDNFITTDPNMQDILLRNDGDYFTDLSDELPHETARNSTGVVPGDFDNDGHVDFFVYRHGDVRIRTNDVMLLNKGGGHFQSWLRHNATTLNERANGDMGAAVDADLDGDVDIISGNAKGSWHVYHNRLEELREARGNHVLVHVGYNAAGVDAVGATVQVTTADGTQTRVVGSGSSAFSQSLLDTVHFGIADAKRVESVRVRWRDGTVEERSDLGTRGVHRFGRNGLMLQSKADDQRPDWDGIDVPADAGDGMKWVLQPETSDSFNYDAPANDKGTEFFSRWTDWYHNHWSGPGLTQWQRDHVKVEDGMLQFHAERAADGKRVELGCVSSKYRVRYPVYIEVEAKVPNSVLACAAWLLSPDDTQEIDFLEAYGSPTSEAKGDQSWFAERIHVSHHVFIREPFQDYQPKDEGSWYYDGGKLWHENFHRYGVFWRDPWNLEYYIDGKLVRTVSGEDIIDPLGYTEGGGLFKEMDIIIDMEDHDWRSVKGLTPTDNELSQAENHVFQVKWIRTYKPEPVND